MLPKEPLSICYGSKLTAADDDSTESVCTRGTILRSTIIRSETALRTAFNRMPCGMTFPTSHQEEVAGNTGGSWRKNGSKMRGMGHMPGNGPPY